VVFGDAELARAAQHGDAASLAVLLERHRADMYAVALRILGNGPDVEDVVQDAMIVALRRIGEVRDPGAAGAWLRALVRNACLMRRRRWATVPLDEALGLVLRSREPSAEEILDRQALRDWVWHALEELTEPLRLVILLRYFSDASSYEQIAALCGVPAGTVRSRLNQAKRKLAEALLAAAALAHRDSASLPASRRREIAELLAAAERGALGPVLAERWWPDARVVWPGDQGVTDLDGLVRGWDIDLTDGVRQRLMNVIASRDVTIIHTELVSPPDAPDHCPPAVVWLQLLRDGRVQRMRLFHPQAGRADAAEPG
jgi:RNA polymerase sigma-70 factor (ECF subfamily)